MLKKGIILTIIFSLTLGFSLSMDSYSLFAKENDLLEGEIDVTDQLVILDDGSVPEKEFDIENLFDLEETTRLGVKVDAEGNEFHFKENGDVEIVVFSPKSLEGKVSLKGISPQCIACVGGTTRITLSTYSSGHTTYGSWSTGVSGAWPLATLKLDRSVSWSNTYSGNLKVPIKKLDLALGFSTSKSGTTTASATLPLKKGYKGRIDYRRAYTVKVIKQTTTSAGKVIATDYITGKKYSHLDYRGVLIKQ